MSFKVEHAEGGYSISIGVGRLFHARTIEEVGVALDHYFRGHKHKALSPPQAIEGCPLCEE